MNKKEKFCERLISHLESGEMMVSEANWLTSESDKLIEKLNILEKEENDFSTSWERKEQITTEQSQIIKSLLEISRRMQIEQKRLLDSFQEDINLMNELDDIDKT